MKTFRKYLNTKSQWHSTVEFPKYPVEKDLIEFLNNQYFKTFKIDWTQYDIHNRSNVINRLFSTKYNDSCYYFFDKIFDASFNAIYLFSGGTVSENNPIFEILVYPEKNKIDKYYYAGIARYDGNYYSKYNTCKTDKNYDKYNDLVNDITTVFGW